MSIWEIAEVLGRLPNASNATLLARTTADELVVYKPEKGERPLWDFEARNVGPPAKCLPTKWPGRPDSAWFRRPR